MDAVEKCLRFADGSVMQNEAVKEVFIIPPAYALPAAQEPIPKDQLQEYDEVWVEPISADHALREELRGWYHMKGRYVENEVGQRFYMDFYGAKFNRIVSGGRNCFRDHVDVRYVVLGITYMDGDKEYLDASLFEKCELQEFFKLQNQVPDRSSLDNLALEEIMQLLSQLRVPQNYGVELSPWEEILGYEVDPQNVTKVGAAKLSAAVIYDMTFWGFTEEEVLAERKKLEDTAADIERVRALPAEEQKKYFKTANEIFPELKLEDDRTEAQKEQERLESAKEMLKNRLRTLEALNAYRKSCIG